MTESIALAIRGYASAHMDVATSIACEGTALEATTFNLAGKAFMFLRTVPGGQEVRLKLGASRAQIEKLGEQWPDSYSIGSSGWAKVIVSEERSLALVKTWIAESYSIISSGRDGTSGAARVAFTPTVMPVEKSKPTSKRTAAIKSAATKPAGQAAVKKPAPVAKAAAAPAKVPATPAAKPAVKAPAAKAQPVAEAPAAKSAAKATVAKAKPVAEAPAAKPAAKAAVAKAKPAAKAQVAAKPAVAKSKSAAKAPPPKKPAAKKPAAKKPPAKKPAATKRR